MYIAQETTLSIEICRRYSLYNIITLINKSIKKLFIFDSPYAIFISVYDANLRTTTRTSRQNQLQQKQFNDKFQNEIILINFIHLTNRISQEVHFLTFRFLILYYNLIINRRKFHFFSDRRPTSDVCKYMTNSEKPLDHIPHRYIIFF